MCCEYDILLSVEEISVCCEKFCLERISFQLRRNEVLCILGKTGSGKTMLLESIAGFYKTDGGRILFGGQEMTDIPLHKRNIGFLYQDYSLFPHMTVQENIGYGLKMQRECKKIIKKKVFEMAELFGISDLLDQYPGTLSGGEKQRVALARALIRKPPLLLLDEPFSALDPVTKEKMYRLLKKICVESSVAVIFVTHNFEEAQKLSDRIGILVDGKLQGIADCEELYTFSWPENVQEFLGTKRADKS